MEKFLLEQKHLLALEREAELEESRLLQANVSLKELCGKGVAIQKVVIVGQATGLYGRLVVSFGSRHHGQELASHNITSGDIVALRQSTGGQSGAEQDLENVSGVVTKVSGLIVSVAFSESADHLNLDDTALYSLVKLANDVTHRRLTSALNSLSGGNSAVINVLFGVSSPSVPHQTLNPRLISGDGSQLEFFNVNLDSSQRDAVEFCLKQREIGIVHGPPGTGKTTTVVEIIRQSVKAGDRVLVCAPSNVAVDNLLERLASVKLKVVRLGHPARVSSSLQQHSLDAIISNSEEGALVRDVYKELDQTLASNRGKDRRKIQTEVKALRKEIRQREKKALKEILSRADVVLGTLTSSGPDSPLQHLPDKHFSLTIIDECSQSLEAACWIVASSASKLLLAGDHLQLPPTILSSQASKGLGLTLMERIVKMYDSEVTRMLTIQYRMNSRIMQWSSDALYDGKLTAGASVRDHTLSQVAGVQDNEVTQTVLLMVDTAGCHMEELTTQDNISKANEGEAAILYHHVQELTSMGVSTGDIAIVTPYNLQVELLRMNMRERFPSLEIKSVDGYQGREKEVVLLSLVRSNHKKEVGFLGESRRLNVAVTRARRQLIVVCDTETVKSDSFLKEFVEYMESNGEVRTADMYQDLPSIDRPEGLVVADGQRQPEHEIKEGKKTQNIKERKVKKVKETKSNTASNSRQQQTETKNNKVAEDIEMDKDETRRDQYEALLQEFVSSKENFKTFSADLNSFERRLVHELSEEYNLIHESIGEGNKRYIMISKKVGKEKIVPLPSSVAKGSVKVANPNTTSEDVKILTPEIKMKETEGVELKRDSSTENISSSNIVECNTCKKMVPKTNIDLHKIRCSVISAETMILNETTAAVKSKKSKKKSVRSQGPEAKQEVNEDDFDGLCEQFQKLDKICNFPKCKSLVATIGVNCKFCLVRFCLSHSMAEIHGCGEEARKAARQQISRDGRLVPGSGLINHKPDKDKRAQLEKKLEKKLGEKNIQRQRKKKE